MRPSFGTRRTRLPGMQKLYDISDSFFCAMHIGAFQLNSSFEKSHFGTQHVKKKSSQKKAIICILMHNFSEKYVNQDSTKNDERYKNSC